MIYVLLYLYLLYLFQIIFFQKFSNNSTKLNFKKVIKIYQCKKYRFNMLLFIYLFLNMSKNMLLIFRLLQYTILKKIERVASYSFEFCNINVLHPVIFHVRENTPKKLFASWKNIFANKNK